MSEARSATRWRALWPLLFPLAYLLHIVEEVLGGVGFVQWTSYHLGGRLTVPLFALINGIAWPAVLVAAIVGSRVANVRWVLVAVASILFVNGFLHVGSSIVTSSYSPGTLTGVLLYLPLTIWALRRLVREVPRNGIWIGVLTGLAIHLLVFVVAFGRA